MISARHRRKNRGRRGAPWTEEEDERLLAMARLPPRAIADRMRRSWLACRRRLIYLQADRSGAGAPLAGCAKRALLAHAVVSARHKESGEPPAFFVARGLGAIRAPIIGDEHAPR